MDRFVVAVVVGRPCVEQRPQDRQRLTEPLDTRPGWADRLPDRLVLGLVVAGAEPEHEPAVGEPVDGGRGAGEQHGLVELVVEHQWTDPESLGRQCGHDERRERVDGTDVVVAVQLVVPQRLDPPRVLAERDRVVEGTALHGEPERAGGAAEYGIVGHGHRARC